MRILCLIDSLGSGGAQRQLVTLAVGLKKRGHEVRFLVYHPHDHFLSLLQDAGIPRQVVPPCSYVKRVLAIRHILRQGWQDVVLAFLEAPCLYAEIASIPHRRWGLVVGERSANPAIMKSIGSVLRQFHHFADAIVCNSHTANLILEVKHQSLKKKMATVYNLVDLQEFMPASFSHRTGTAADVHSFRIVVVASYQENKNMMGVAKALLHLKSMNRKQKLVVDWFGAVQPDSTPFDKVKKFITENGLVESFRLNNETHDITIEFSNADAVGLFSFFEGLPNVVCEGMACGKPILLSNVCDAGNLVRDGVNGFLCNPESPENIAEIIHKMVTLSKIESQSMGLESRKMAEHLFDEDIVVGRYERILSSASKREPVPPVCNWPADVPETATMTVERWMKK